MPEKSLTDVIQQSGTETEKKLDDVLDLMRKTESGREALASMEGTGFNFSVEAGLGDVFGYCEAENKKIVLNAVGKKETLAAVLSHEIRHAVQHGKDANLSDIARAQVSDLYKQQRGMEADACAHQAAFVYESKKAGMEMNMPEGYEAIFETYSTEIEKTNNKKQAMNAAFKAWYKNAPIMNWYDNRFKPFVRDAVAQLVGDNVKTGFSEKVTDEHLANLFDYKGKPYVEPEFFSSPTAHCLRQNDKETVMAMMKRYSQRTDAPLDSSVLEMADRHENGKIIQNDRKNQEESNKPAVAALIALKAKQR